METVFCLRGAYAELPRNHKKCDSSLRGPSVRNSYGQCFSSCDSSNSGRDSGAKSNHTHTNKHTRARTHAHTQTHPHTKELTRSLRGACAGFRFPLDFPAFCTKPSHLLENGSMAARTTNARPSQTAASLLPGSPQNVKT